MKFAKPNWLFFSIAPASELVLHRRRQRLMMGACGAEASIFLAAPSVLRIRLSFFSVRPSGLCSLSLKAMSDGATSFGGGAGPKDTPTADEVDRPAAASLPAGRSARQLLSRKEFASFVGS